MWFLIVAMLVILVLAALVVVYVAFPHRGEEVPYAGWLGEALQRGVDTAPTLDNTAEAGDHAADAAPDSLVHDLAALDHGRPDGRRRA